MTLLDELAGARLVTVDRDTVELAHEALIRHWPRLQEWLAEDREGLEIHRQLTLAAWAADFAVAAGGGPPVCVTRPAIIDTCVKHGTFRD